MRLTSLVPVLVFVAALPACRAGQSIEAARQATASFRESAFARPPRTTKDVTAVLELQPRDLARIREHQATADRPAPEGVSSRELMLFHHERSQAASLAGRPEQGLEDLRLALRHADGASAGVLERRPILRALARAEAAAGNHVTAVTVMKQALNEYPQSVGNTVMLAELYAQVGDVVLARALIGGIQRGMRGAPNVSDPWPDFQPPTLEFMLLEAQGKWAEAEPFIRESMDRFRRSPPGDVGLDGGLVWLARRRQRLAENLRRQERFVEAEVESRQALVSLLRAVGKYTLHTAEAVLTLASPVGAQGRHADAEALARSALEILDTMGVAKDAAALAEARRTLGKSLAAQGRWEESSRQFVLLRQGLGARDFLFEKFYGRDIDVALALLEAGRFDEALTVARAAHDHHRRHLGSGHVETMQARAVLGLVLGARGETRGAIDALIVVVPAFTARGRTTAAAPHGRGTDWRARTIVEGYIDILARAAGTPLEREWGLDAAGEAFRLADLLRGGSVQGALTATAARAAIRDPDLADLARREQDAARQAGALLETLRDLLAAPAAEQNVTTAAALRQQIATLTTARDTLSAEITRRFPDYADLVNPRPAGVADARAALRPGEALIATYAGRRRSYVWAVPHRGDVSFATLPLASERLDGMVKRVRAALAPEIRTFGDIPAFDLVAAHELYVALLEPVAAGWKGARSLLVAPHGSLGFLPLSVLPMTAARQSSGSAPPMLFAEYRDVPWLGREYAFTMLPSVASLVTLRRMPPGKPDRLPFVGFGDPYFTAQQAAGDRRDAAAPSTPRRREVRLRDVRITGAGSLDGDAVPSTALAMLQPLPETAEELTSIAEALGADPRRDVFLGRQANEEQVKRMDLSSRRVIAFATHALVPGDLDGLDEPALALSSPDVAGASDDGLLTTAEILALRLDADWVVLSACNTAAAGGAGAEAVSGLGRAFFYAGARALLVSHWPVETSSAKALTTGLFRRQARDPSLSRAEALRQTIVAMIDGPGLVEPEGGRSVVSYAHPLFWAPFTIVGDGG